MFLYCLREAAKRIPVDENNDLRERILQDKEFYEDWLAPRIERFYKEKGWPFNDVLQRGSDIHGTSGPIVRSPDATVVSGACCLPFGMKACRRIKSLRARKRSGARHVDTTCEAPQPQVRCSRQDLIPSKFRRDGSFTFHSPYLTLLPPVDETQMNALDVDQRLLQKWQTRRDARTTGQISRRVPSIRLLTSLLVALCAAFIHWLFFSDGKDAYRFRAFAAMAFAACVVLVCTIW